MAEKSEGLSISVHPEKCHGCLCCELRCSLRSSGTFNPTKAHIRVMRFEGGYGFLHSFTDQCDGCQGDYLCVKWCPYGTLRLERG
jgi:NAD-dependent dihydropyrimidine dehydrogenase PreA subunit